MVLMEKTYRPEEIEKKRNACWQEARCFEAKDENEIRNVSYLLCFSDSNVRFRTGS